MIGLTRAQNRCLQVLASLTKGGISPSVGEIAQAMGFEYGKGNVHRFLTELERKGHIVRHRASSGRQIARAIEIISKPQFPAPKIDDLAKMRSGDLKHLVLVANAILDGRKARAA